MNQEKLTSSNKKEDTKSCLRKKVTTSHHLREWQYAVCGTVGSRAAVKLSKNQ